jgi:hypothetical protein
MIRRDAFSACGYNREAVEFAMSLALARVEEARQLCGIHADRTDKMSLNEVRA